MSEASEAPGAVSAGAGVDRRLITCILPKGAALKALQALRDEYNIVSANISNARGVGRLTPLRHRGVGEQPEKEILAFVVDAEQADEAFEFMFDASDINTAHGGIIYMSMLSGATHYLLPDVPAED
jgi:hypothetical protein